MLGVDAVGQAQHAAPRERQAGDRKVVRRRQVAARHLVLDEVGGERRHALRRAPHRAEPGEDVARMLDGAAGLELVRRRPGGAGLVDPLRGRREGDGAVIHLGIGEPDAARAALLKRAPQGLRGGAHQRARRGGEVQAARGGEVSQRDGVAELHRHRLLGVDVLSRFQERAARLVVIARVGQVQDQDRLARQQLLHRGVGPRAGQRGEGLAAGPLAVVDADEVQLGVQRQGQPVHVGDVAAAEEGDLHGAALLSSGLGVGAGDGGPLRGPQSRNHAAGASVRRAARGSSTVAPTLLRRSTPRSRRRPSRT